MVWYNSRVRINDRPIYWPFCNDKGLQKVKHLLTPEGNWKTHQQIESEFKVNIPFTMYWGLCEAIPKEWKLCTDLSVKAAPTVRPLDQLKDCKNRVALLYRKISESQTLLQSYHQNWLDKFPMYRFSYDEMIAAVRKITKITNVVKLRSFQYRMLLGTTVTNVKLKRYGIKDSDLCSFCNGRTETIPHLFWECVKVKEIWDWVCRKYGRNIRIP